MSSGILVDETYNFLYILLGKLETNLIFADCEIF